MKKVLLSVLAILVLAGNAFAVTKETQYNLEDQTVFGKVNLSGSSNVGNPGYVSFQAPTLNGADTTYYLWVNGAGKLCLASYPIISTYSSFPSGNWNNQSNGMGCVVVGGQS